ncbi:hypothetical protein Y032_0004g1845 [Ancylostoma ceylanicum]|uniref:Uncharacterized protein n=1 Tax=Ancylostoma ceylanicum TaxID=53326 RepID=A0A016VUA8_9BILA|nr:hypothetical protein Y032_0004g1845 [Ancylostoma ceylanicum]
MEWLIRYGGRAENVPGYDCNSSYHNVGTTNYPFGAASFIVGFGGEIVYALDLMIMIKKKYRSLSYYKIMIALGICDMSAIFLICIMNGYFWMVGATYCTNPNLMRVNTSNAYVYEDKLVTMAGLKYPRGEVPEHSRVDHNRSIVNQTF